MRSIKKYETRQNIKQQPVAARICAGEKIARGRCKHTTKQAFQDMRTMSSCFSTL